MTTPPGADEGAVNLTERPEDTVRRFATQLVRIRGLHSSDGAESPFCTECGHSWPCATLRTMHEDTGPPSGTGRGGRLAAALYLDLDGTVRQGKDDPLGRFVNGPEDVVVFPEAVARMRAWKQAGGRIVAVTNQGGVALGIVDIVAATAALAETQRQCDGLFDAMHMCIHHPRAADPEMARCWCRKPSAGAVVEAQAALKRCFPGEYYPPHLGLFVGDRPEDAECARSAGLDFQWAAEWRERRG